MLCRHDCAAHPARRSWRLLSGAASFALCCIVGTAALAGAAWPRASRAQGAALGKPAPTAPAGYVAPLKPTFTWSAVHGAAGYELRVFRALLLDKTGIVKPSWMSNEALPMNVSLTWDVRATAAAGPGPWSDGLQFQIGAADLPTMGMPHTGSPRPPTPPGRWTSSTCIPRRT